MDTYVLMFCQLIYMKLIIEAHESHDNFSDINNNYTLEYY